MVQRDSEWSPNIFSSTHSANSTQGRKSCLAHVPGPSELCKYFKVTFHEGKPNAAARTTLYSEYGKSCVQSVA